MLENIILDILDRYKGYIFWIIYKKNNNNFVNININ